MWPRELNIAARTACGYFAQPAESIAKSLLSPIASNKNLLQVNVDSLLLQE